mmetsp:Transcript_64819/g.146185  ORF Transcript_64819/g.146185 Transcript_64819/m.146185 type:complete len:301 (-) Transcript_64819:60-962(-)
MGDGPGAAPLLESADPLVHLQAEVLPENLSVLAVVAAQDAEHGGEVCDPLLKDVDVLGLRLALHGLKAVEPLVESQAAIPLIEDVEELLALLGLEVHELQLRRHLWGLKGFFELVPGERAVLVGVYGLEEVSELLEGLVQLDLLLVQEGLLVLLRGCEGILHNHSGDQVHEDDGRHCDIDVEEGPCPRRLLHQGPRYGIPGILRQDLHKGVHPVVYPSNLLQQLLEGCLVFGVLLGLVEDLDIHADQHHTEDGKNVGDEGQEEDCPDQDASSAHEALDQQVHVVELLTPLDHPDKPEEPE